MNRDNFQRRTVLKGIAGGVGVTGLAGTAAAQQQKVGADERQRILETPEVQRVLSEAGAPTVESAEKVVAPLGSSGDSIVGYILQTTVGKLVFGRAKSHEVARLTFSGDISAADLPEKYEIAARVEYGAVTTDLNGGTLFLRAPTEQELRALSRIQGVDIDNSKVYYTDEVGGFGVKPQDSDSPALKVAVSSDGSGEVSTTEIASAKTQEFRSSESCDVGACETCVGNLVVSSGACGAICAAGAVSPPVSLPILIPCLVCVASSGVSLGYFCSECLETCK
jgi:hypothetical protein